MKPPEFSTERPLYWPKRFTFDTEFTRDERRLLRWSLAARTREGAAQVWAVEGKSRGLAPQWVDEHTVITQYAPADMEHLAYLSYLPWQRFRVEDTVWKHAVLYSDHEHSLNYLGSLWSSLNRWKHLSGEDPQLYSACDAYGLMEVDEALEKELNRDPQSRKVWQEIDQPAIQSFVEAQYRGLLVDGERLTSVIGSLREEADEAQRRAVAIAGWPIKLSSPQQVAHRLFKVERLRG